MGKNIYPNQMTPKNKMSAKKNILLLTAYISYTKLVRFYPSLPVSVTVTIFTVSAFIFPTLPPNIPILFTAFPQRIIISSVHCIGHTATS
jgi:hypothetical protein